MYRSLHHFIVLIMIMHVLWYDTRQENNYFITKVIDKRKKKKRKMLPTTRIEPMSTYKQCLSEAKNSNSPTILTPRPRRYIVRWVIKGMSFKPVRWGQFYEFGCEI